MFHAEMFPQPKLQINRHLDKFLKELFSYFSLNFMLWTCFAQSCGVLKSPFLNENTCSGPYSIGDTAYILMKKSEKKKYPRSNVKTYNYLGSDSNKTSAPMSCCAFFFLMNGTVTTYLLWLCKISLQTLTNRPSLKSAISPEKSFKFRNKLKNLKHNDGKDERVL